MLASNLSLDHQVVRACSQTCEAVEIRFRRNCVAKPYQLAVAFCFISAISLTIGISFFIANAPWVLVFSVLEISALFVAFVYYAKHAVDSQTIVLTNQKIFVRKDIGGLVELVPFDRVRARTAFQETGADRIVLNGPARSICFGGVLRYGTQERLHQALSEYMRYAELDRCVARIVQLVENCGATVWISTCVIDVHEDTYEVLHYRAS